MNTRPTHVRITVETVDGRKRRGADQLFNVVIGRGRERVVIPLGWPRSQAAYLAHRLGDVIAPAPADERVDVVGQLSFL